jgi:hypothetical protein
MSIEQKIAQILAESKLDDDVDNVEVDGGTKPEQSQLDDVTDGVTDVDDENEDNDRNDVDKQDVGGKNKTTNPANKDAVEPEKQPQVAVAGIEEDVAALVEGENLTEEFKQKAATIFEAAVINRVKQEVAKLDEAYEAKLNEQVEQIKEGLVEKVDGYLDYVVEQWMKHNEIALERGMKSDILEQFVGGLKSLFEQSYIEIPEEKFDVLGSLEHQVEQLRSKLDEQIAHNVDLNKQLAGYQINLITAELSEGLAETDKEKFRALVEELEFDGVESYRKKAQTIRESYFTTKATTKKVVESVVTDAPVTLAEEKVVPAHMRGYLSALDNLK